MIKQDRIWKEIERDDPRQIEIIELTGHHEFGPNMMMANVGRPEELHEIRRLFNEGKWAISRARYWAYVYGFVAKATAGRPRPGAAVCLVRYEDLCARLGSDDRPDPGSTPASRPHNLRPRAKPTTRETLTSRLLQALFDAAELAEIVSATYRQRGRALRIRRWSDRATHCGVGATA